MQSIQVSPERGGEQQQCYFCCEVNINHCMIRSLYHKHDDLPDKHLEAIQQLITAKESASKSKYQEMIYLTNEEQQLTTYLHQQQSEKEMEALLEYYKYRIYVPSFAYSRVSQSIHAYYYERLKLYYNSIKRNLNMTLEPESTITDTIAQSSDQETPTTLLNDLTKNLHDLSDNNGNGDNDNNGDNGDNGNKLEEITYYQTESKALEDVIQLMKRNEKFKKVRALKTQDYLQEVSPANNQHLFRDHQLLMDKFPILNRKNKKAGVFFKFSSNINSNSNSNSNSNTLKKAPLGKKSVKSIEAFKYHKSREKDRSSEEVDSAAFNKKLFKNKELKNIDYNNRNININNVNTGHSHPEQGFKIRPIRSSSCLNVIKMSSARIDRSPYQKDKTPQKLIRIKNSNSHSQKILRRVDRDRMERIDDRYTVRAKASGSKQIQHTSRDKLTQWRRMKIKEIKQLPVSARQLQQKYSSYPSNNNNNNNKRRKGNEGEQSPKKTEEERIEAVSSHKKNKVEVDFDKNDNIITIRQKKLDMLKAKTNKR